MVDRQIETRPTVSPHLTHILRIGEMTNHTTAVNSVTGLVSETYPWDKPIVGLSTMGLNTCSAIAGYYIKDSRLELFLAHVQPLTAPETILRRLALDGVEGITLDYINGSVTKPERNERFKLSVEQFFRERHINMHSIPAEQIRAMKAPMNEKIHSYGALLSMEKAGEAAAVPVLTIIDEI